MGSTDQPDGTAGKRRAAPGTYQGHDGQWWAFLGSGSKRRKVRCPAAKNTQAEAKRLRKQLEAERAAGLDTRQGRQKVTAWAQAWLTAQVDKGIKPKSLRFYRQILENQILPSLGELRLDKTSPDDVLELLATLQAAQPGETPDAPPWFFASRTVRHAYDVGKRIFAAALKRRLIPHNPFDAIDAPPVTETEQATLTPEQQRLLLDAVAGHRLELAYLLLLIYGLREGEVLGLRPADCDLKNRTLTIAQQVQAVDGIVLIGTPKTKRSSRTLPIPPALVPFVQARLAALAVEQEADAWTDHGLLFPSEVGTPMQPRNFVRHYKATLRRAMLPGVLTVHQLRHTANSRLAALGASDTHRCWLLGHTVGGVQGRYTHAEVEALRPWIEGAAAQVLGLVKERIALRSVG